MSEEKLHRLTPSDPVPGAVLAQFEELSQARMRIAVNLLDLEQEKIRMLAAAKRVDEQKQRLFEHVLVERGLPPNTQVEIDRGGRIHLMQPSPRRRQSPWPDPRSFPFMGKLQG